MTPQELERVVGGFQPSIVILAANHAGVFTTLVGSPMAPDALAARLGLDARALATLADALVCLGALERRDGLLAVPEALRATFDPASSTSMDSAFTHQWHVLQRWARLDAVLETGRPLPRGRQDDEQLRAFILAMADMARRGAWTLWDNVDLGAFGHLVDVGGGPGELTLAALERFPNLTATVFDLPDVLPIARGYAAGRAVGRRLDFKVGDALKSRIPPCDVALVSSLLHSYGPDGVAKIARNVAAGVRPGGLVLIREFMWDDEAHSGPPTTALFAVNMLSGTPDGQCWAPSELERIFGGAGFGDWGSHRLDARTSLLVGVRAGR
ncbi:MAG: methyltransferase domain-containing protein [Acidobacteriia bacterium]|nr:methyltransferase domain-containing protein [Terriglobia bacterium]